MESNIKIAPSTAKAKLSNENHLKQIKKNLF